LRRMTPLQLMLLVHPAVPANEDGKVGVI
jgi:hypothetical protein